LFHRRRSPGTGWSWRRGRCPADSRSFDRLALTEVFEIIFLMINCKYRSRYTRISRIAARKPTGLRGAHVAADARQNCLSAAQRLISTLSAPRKPTGLRGTHMVANARQNSLSAAQQPIGSYRLLESRQAYVTHAWQPTHVKTACRPLKGR
jgi:hypothetical protein